MHLTLKKSNIEGSVNSPASKSLTHRALLAGIQANGITKINNPLDCNDTKASLEISRELGAEITIEKDKWIIKEINRSVEKSKILNCQDSGTTMRLFLPYCTLINQELLLTGNESLLRRPIGALIDAVNQLGGKCSSVPGNGMPPVQISPSKLNGGKVSIPGNISSQFISGLLFACPAAESNTEINISTELESVPYIELTLGVLEDFGIKVEAEKDYRKFSIPSNQEFTPKDYTIEGDFSSAAFLLAAGILSGKVEVKNLSKNSLQADRKIVDILKEMGADIKWNNGILTANKSSLNATEIDVKNCPDLVPILAALSTQAKGKTRIYNAERLRIKESDRLEAITSELKKMGASIEQKKAELLITGPVSLNSASINPHNDHRIAMSCAVAGLLAPGTVIEQSECITKSFPGFVHTLKELGADAIETA